MKPSTRLNSYWRLFFVLLSVTSVGCGSDFGEKLVINKAEIYYKNGVTQADAQRLGDKLEKMKFINGQAKSVQLQKRYDVWELRMVVDEGMDSEATQKQLKLYGLELSSGFDGNPFEMHICDRNLQSVSIVRGLRGKRYQLGNTAFFYDGVDLSKVKEFAAIASATRLDTGVGTAFHLSRTGSKIEIRVADSAADKVSKPMALAATNTATVASNKLFAGNAVDVLICDRYFDTSQVFPSVDANTVEAQRRLGATPEGELDLHKQRNIWNAEHITFEIEKRFGAKLKSAIANRNQQELSSLIRDDFVGHVFSADVDPKVTKHGGLSQAERSGKASKTVGRDGLLGELLRPMAVVKQIDSVGMRVLKIDQMKGSHANRWWAEILLTATGKGEQGELHAFDSRQQVEFQYKEKEEFDGKPVVAKWDVFSDRLRTSDQFLMHEVTLDYGLDELPLVDNWTTSDMPQQWHFQMAVEDYDRDGFLDIAIATYDGRPILLRSVNGKAFEDVSEAFSFVPWHSTSIRYLASWIDFDNDGFPDLILGNRLYRNRSGKAFKDVSAASGLKIGSRAMGCAIADYDADGLLDIYVSYQNSGRAKDGEPLPWVGDSTSGQLNALWKNLGGGRFVDVTEATQTSGGTRNSLAASWLYANGDSLPDLYVANDFGTNVMFHSRADGKFDDVSESTGLADYATSMGVTTGDINNDGQPEIYVANMYSKMGRRIIAHVEKDDYAAGIHDQIKGACAGNRLYQYDETTERYKDRSVDLRVNEIGWAFAPTMADLDNDGFLDMYATTGFMSFERGKPDG